MGESLRSHAARGLEAQQQGVIGDPDAADATLAFQVTPSKDQRHPPRPFFVSSSAKFFSPKTLMSKESEFR